MDLGYLKQLLELAKEYNLKKIKTDSIDIEFSENTGTHTAIIPNLGKPDKIPTEDEFLFMSSEGMPVSDKDDKE